MNKNIVKIISIFVIIFNPLLNSIHYKKNTYRVKNTSINSKFIAKNSIDFKKRFKQNYILNSSAKINNTNHDNTSITTLSNAEQFVVITATEVGVVFGIVIGIIMGILLGADRDFVSESKDLEMFTQKNLTLQQANKAFKNVIPLYLLNSYPEIKKGITTPIITIMGGLLGGGIAGSFAYAGSIIYNSTK